MSDNLYFISYSRSEMYYAEALTHDLQAAGFDVWFDLQQLIPGSQWQEGIQQGLADATGLIVIVSRSALQSPYVAAEYQHAMDLQKPVYLVIVESVNIDTDDLKTLMAYASATFDARSDFRGLVSRLSNTLRTNQSHKDAIPTPNRLGLPTKLPRALWLVAGGMLLLIAMLMAVAVVASSIFLPAVLASVVLIAVVIYELKQFLTRVSFTGTRYSLFLGALFCWLVIPWLTPILLMIWLVSVLSRDMTRWAPRGEGLIRADETTSMYARRAARHIISFVDKLVRLYFVLVTTIGVMLLVITRFLRFASVEVRITIGIVAVLVLVYLVERWLRNRPFYVSGIILLASQWLGGLIGTLFALMVYGTDENGLLNVTGAGSQSAFLTLTIVGIVFWLLFAVVLHKAWYGLRARVTGTSETLLPGRDTTFRIVHSSFDQVLANQVGGVMKAAGYRNITTSGELGDINFLILTGYVTKRLAEQSHIHTGRWIIVVGSALIAEGWHSRLTDMQWFDFRRQDKEQLRSLARDIVNPQLDRVSGSVSTRTTPQSFYKTVLPLRVRIYTLIQIFGFLLSIVNTTRRLTAFQTLSAFDGLSLIVGLGWLWISVGLVHRIIRREISLRQLYYFNMGYVGSLYVLGLLVGLSQPLPPGAERSVSGILAGIIGALIGAWLTYQFMQYFLGNWLPRVEVSAGGSWTGDRHLYRRNIVTVLIVALLTIVLFGATVRYDPPLVIPDDTAREGQVVVTEEVPLAALVRRMNPISGHQTAAVGRFMTRQDHNLL